MEQKISRIFNKVNRVSGELNLPGDKSISHRALIFSALSDGKNEITNLSSGEDVQSTIKCLNQLGITIYKNNDLTTVIGRGFKGFSEPREALYAGNSGTTARLLTGLLSLQDFPVKITGDSSLSKRPMSRIIEPLSSMGAVIKSGTGTLPIEIYPSERIIPADYKMVLPSAQVKSAVILAGLHLKDESKVTEYIQSRDHTERMLNLRIVREERKTVIYSSSEKYPQAKNYSIPSDISSAVFFIVLALLTPDSELSLKNISLNPTRSGILEILIKMGASIKTENIKVVANEPSGDIIVRSSVLKNINIDHDMIPNIIDEIPALAVAGIFAEGDFSISGAGELRHKESDRISALCENLGRTGLKVEEFIDGFNIKGNINDSYFKFDSFGDHRIAMALSILNMISEKGGEVDNFSCVNISNPQFLIQLSSITA